MDQHEQFLLNLDEANIPRQAKILNLGYTPQEQGVMPTEIHGTIIQRHFIPHQLYLYGRPHGKKKENGKIRILVSVTWLPPEILIPHWNNLTEAAEAFAIHNYQSMVIPANVAVESKLNNILEEYLCRYASNKRVKDFLSNGGTYSHQLNVLLPLLVHFEKFPNIPDFICGNLNSLRKLRNNVAHDGQLDPELAFDRAAELLCSSFFALGYLNLLEIKLKENYA